MSKEQTALPIQHPVVVRKGTRDDLNLLTELFIDEQRASKMESGYFGIIKPEISIYIGQWLVAFDNSTTLCYILQKDKKIIGYIVGTINNLMLEAFSPQKIITITMFYLVVEYRKHLNGVMLLQKLEEVADKMELPVQLSITSNLSSERLSKILAKRKWLHLGCMYVRSIKAVEPASNCPNGGTYDG